VGQRTIAEVELHLRFERGARPFRRPAAATLPERCQSIGQGDRRAILDIDAIEPLEQGDRHGVSNDGLVHGVFQNLFQTIGRCRGKTMIQPLGRERHAQTRGGLCQLVIGGVGIVPPTEHQGLGEFGTRELGLALHKARCARGVIRHRRQNCLERLAKL
jgi:hypothetical protein